MTVQVIGTSAGGRLVQTQTWAGSSAAATSVAVATATGVWSLSPWVASSTTRPSGIQPSRWLDGASGPRAGARFRGHVRRNGRGPVYWTTCTVTASEPGREFAFAVGGPGTPSTPGATSSSPPRAEPT